MKTNIFLPSKIKVGSVYRSYTFNGKLSYVIYYDNNNKLCKEPSFESWRDKSIEPLEFDNKPVSGFILNQTAGGYKVYWNNRQTTCRVYDPRGFELEIDIDNLLYILEYSTCKQKHLEGEFIYGWSKGKLILIPIISEDYKDIIIYNETIKTKIKKSDLKLGNIYINIYNEKLCYLGYFEKYNWYGNSEGKYYYFKNINRNNIGDYFVFYKSIDCIFNTNSQATIDEVNEFYSNLSFSMSFIPKDLNYYKVVESPNIQEKMFVKINNEYIELRRTDNRSWAYRDTKYLIENKELTLQQIIDMYFYIYQIDEKRLMNGNEYKFY